MEHRISMRNFQQTGLWRLFACYPAFLHLLAFVSLSLQCTAICDPLGILFKNLFFLWFSEMWPQFLSLNFLIHGCVHIFFSLIRTGIIWVGLFVAQLHLGLSATMNLASRVLHFSIFWVPSEMGFFYTMSHNIVSAYVNLDTEISLCSSAIIFTFLFFRFCCFVVYVCVSFYFSVDNVNNRFHYSLNWGFSNAAMLMGCDLQGL